MKGLIVGLIGLGVAVVLGAILLFMYVGYSNSEVQLRNQITAKQKANEASFDTCWKIIKQQAQVAETYKDGFKEIYVGLMEGRHYEKGGALMKFITEANPAFDIRLFEKVSNSIEAQRTSFLRDQQQLLDLKREHDNLLDVLPGSIFVGGRPRIEVKIITSGATQETFRTGEENDVDVFGSRSRAVEKE